MKAILTWHSIDESASVISTSSNEFERQLDALAASGTSIVRLDEIAERDDGNAVALTFDDGYSNFVSDVLPSLTARRLPATVFVVPGCVGRFNEWDNASRGIPRLPLMSWSEIADVPRDMIDVGAHGFNHVSLRNRERAFLEKEITACVETIASFSSSVPRSFAFPYGDVDALASDVVAESFAVACTTRLAVVSGGESRFNLPRLDSYYFRDNDELSHFGTARFAAYAKLREAGRAARASIKRRTRRGSA